MPSCEILSCLFLHSLILVARVPSCEILSCLFLHSLILVARVPRIHCPTRVLQILAKTMIQGLKTVIWCCSNYRQPKVPDASGSGAGGVPSQPAVIRRPMTAEERDHTAKFFKWALPCLRVFTKSGGVVSPGESKDALDAFAGAFTVLGPYDLRTAVSWYSVKGTCFQLVARVPGYDPRSVVL